MQYKEFTTFTQAINKSEFDSRRGEVLSRKIDLKHKIVSSNYGTSMSIKAQ